MRHHPRLLSHALLATATGGHECRHRPAPPPPIFTSGYTSPTTFTQAAVSFPSRGAPAWALHSTTL